MVSSYFASTFPSRDIYRGLVYGAAVCYVGRERGVSKPLSQM